MSKQILFFRHSFFYAKGSDDRDTVVQKLAQPPLTVVAGAFRNMIFVPTAVGEEYVLVTPETQQAKKRKKNSLLGAKIRVRKGVSGQQYKVSTGMPITLIVAFLVGILSYAAMYMFLMSQSADVADDLLGTALPLLLVFTGAMFLVMFYLYTRMHKVLLELLKERLGMVPDGSAVQPNE